MSHTILHKALRVFPDALVKAYPQLKEVFEEFQKYLNNYELEDFFEEGDFDWNSLFNTLEGQTVEGHEEELADRIQQAYERILEAFKGLTGLELAVVYVGTPQDDFDEIDNEYVWFIPRGYWIKSPEAVAFEKAYVPHGHEPYPVVWTQHHGG